MALDPVSNIIHGIETVVNKIWPDANEQEKSKFAKFIEEIKLIIGQIEINKAEATHASVFVAGWRPFIGWTCGLGLAWHYVAAPFLMFVLSIFKIAATPPQLDMNALMTLLLGMLGLAGYRTYETVKDKVRSKL